MSILGEYGAFMGVKNIKACFHDVIAKGSNERYRHMLGELAYLNKSPFCKKKKKKKKKKKDNLCRHKVAFLMYPTIQKRVPLLKKIVCSM